MKLFRTSLIAALLLVALAPFARAQECAQPKPVPVSPHNGATNVTSPVTFVWSPVAGTYGYKVFASYDGGPFEQIGDTTATDYTDNQPPGTKVDWYVEAKFDACNSRSQTFTFTTKECVTAVPSLFSPADQSVVGSPVRFQWSEVPEAEFYRIWIVQEVDDELTFDVLEETWHTSTVVRLPPGVYGWFIETIFACDSSYSDPFVFLVERSANCTQARPTAISPAEGSVATSPVTFAWNAVPGAIGYQVWAALDDGDFEFVDETEADRTSTRVYVGSGNVKWIVIAQFDGCDDTISEENHFSIAYDPNCDNDAPYPISPPYAAADTPTKVDFIWTPVARAKKYNVIIVANDGDEQVIGSTTNTRLSATVPAGEIWWAVEVEFDGCSPDISPASFFTSSSDATCRPPVAPDLYVDPEALSGDQYVVIWSPGVNTASYEVQESTSADFAGATTHTTQDVLLFTNHSVSSATRYYYRVRSTSSCGQGIGPYSETASVVITPNTTLSADDAELVSSYGKQSVVVQKVHIPGTASVGNVAGKAGSAGDQFTATTDKPWLKVEPSSGIIPPEGIDVTVTADPRELPAGTNTGTIILNTTASAEVKSVPFSINLVTPVTPSASNSPTSSSLIIPAIAHAEGVGAKFESDVRITNASAQVMKYLLNFTPSNSDGTKSGQQATIQIDPGSTAALNDILRNFYGFATASDNVSGTLEIRPVMDAGSRVSAVPADVTFASSRTYANTPDGTFGQFVPAIKYSDFISRNGVLSLQQVAKSASYRTNIGLVEGSGQPATVLISVYNDRGDVLSEQVRDMLPGSHVQFPLDTTVENGRVEVKVTNGEGRVTAYASVLDNKTADPLLVMPVAPAQVSSRRFILPGIADLNTGSASWRSDVRLYNAGTAPATVTLLYYPQNDSANPKTVTRTIQPGQVDVIDNALQSLYSLSNSGGSMIVTTPADAKLVTSARTYNQTSNGTYGQFIPGLTSTEGVGVDDRALQILQIEESDRFRTNLGLFELTGNPVTVELSATVPDSRISSRSTLQLAGNQFLQISAILNYLGVGRSYNARVTVKVVNGTGRIGGYASLIDNRTQDPTYVPAQ